MRYVNPILEEQYFEEVIIYFRINDLLYDDSSPQISLLLQNINEIGKKCKSYAFKHVFVSSIRGAVRVKQRGLMPHLNISKTLCKILAKSIVKTSKLRIPSVESYELFSVAWMLVARKIKNFDVSASEKFDCKALLPVVEFPPRMLLSSKKNFSVIAQH